MKNRSILSFLLSLLFILPARAYDIPEVSVGLRLGEMRTLVWHPSLILTPQ